MRITTPDEIEQSLFEGDLEYSDREKQRATSLAVSQETLREWERSRVTIGEPRCWPVTDFFPVNTLPQSLTSLFRKSDFFVVRLACSFRAGQETRVQWARFTVELAPDDPGKPPPLAYDMHPLEVFEERKMNYKVELSPTLKFKELAEVAVGKAGVEFEYKELVPAITAYGAEQSLFSWDLEQTPQHPLQGVRWFHAVVEKPKEVQHVRARFDIVADVITPQGLWRAALRDQASMQIERVICT